MNNAEDIYTLALDNNYFDDNILIDKNERIIPIRVMKADKIINKDTYKMNILISIKIIIVHTYYMKSSMVTCNNVLKRNTNNRH